MNLKKNVLILLLILIAFSCKDKDDDNGTIPVQTKISGQWEFILAPDVTVPDTTSAHGYTGADFKEYDCINDEVFLYQDDNGNILGFSGAFKLSGMLNGQNLSLQVYINPDGEYDPMRPLAEMEKFSNMTLILDNFGLLTGTGTFEVHPDYPGIENNTYKVEARMISPINKSGSYNTLYKNGLEVNHWYHKICEEIDKLADWVASKLTDGKIRGMGNCSLHKDGAGYYVLGQEGPGDYKSIFTTTIYYPYQWYHCSSKTYGFEISIKGEHMSMNDLKDAINSTEIKELAKKLGFTLPDDLFFGLELFHNQFGGFGISMAYDTETDNISIYANHLHGSSEDAKNHVLIQTIKSAFESQANHVYVFAGNSIYDTWYLRKSGHFNCNSPLLITYLLGTHKVYYN